MPQPAVPPPARVPWVPSGRVCTSHSNSEALSAGTDHTAPLTMANRPPMKPSWGPPAAVTCSGVAKTPSRTGSHRARNPALKLSSINMTWASSSR